MPERGFHAMALPETGPYLMAALICEKVVQEADGTVTIVRIVDRVNVNITANVPGVNVPETMPPVNVSNLTLFLGLKSGQTRGSQTVTIQMERPDGIKAPAQQLSVLFEGDERGANVFLNLNITLDMQGLYWFIVSLDGEFLTRVPLRLIYHRQGLVPG